VRSSIGKFGLIASCMAAAGCVGTPPKNRDESAPLAAYHQHLLSDATGELWSTQERQDAKELIAQLDDAGIRRAAVLSVAYIYGDERRQVEDEYAKVRAENDWTAAQVARWPQRLNGFCGLSPLRPYALEELERCTRLPNMHGLKLHLGNSGVNLRDADHVERLGTVFAAADARKVPIIIHMKTRTGWPYGREDATTFLNNVVARAPNSLIQIAHFAGAGPGYQDFADEAIQVFVEAIKARDPRTRNLFFDVASIVTSETTPEQAELIVRRIRELGAHRVLFGSDLFFGGNPAPKESWALFRDKLPLTPVELRTIARNTTPYMH
jgi:predicted TIM-barrel fold metal-dependent hydrolase